MSLSRASLLLRSAIFLRQRYQASLPAPASLFSPGQMRLGMPCLELAAAENLSSLNRPPRPLSLTAHQGARFSQPASQLAIPHPKSCQIPSHSHTIIGIPICSGLVLSSPPQTCFVLPITPPLTLLQSMLLSNSSSTSPHTTTLSPRTRYKPCGCSTEGSSSPCSRITRSIVSERTRLVTWSQDTRVPVRVRPSTVRMRTFSGGERGVSLEGFGDVGEGGGGLGWAYCLRRR